MKTTVVRKNNMKAVRMDGKVIGYVGKAKDGWWRFTNAKRAKTSLAGSRYSAVKLLIRREYRIEQMLDVAAEEALARMDKKKLRV